MDSALKQHNARIAGVPGKTIMFAHGFGCDQNMWRFVAPAFEQRFRTLLFDHAGSGRTDPSTYDPERHSSLQGYADDVIRIAREAGVEGGVFVGHSVSAMIGIPSANAGASIPSIGASPAA